MSPLERVLCALILPSQTGHGCTALPNHVREAMLQAGVGKGLVVLESLYLLKIKPETWLRFDQVYRLCRNNFGSSFRLVYEGLRHPLIFQRRKDVGIANRRGARPFLYRVPSAEELVAEFSTTLPSSPTDTLEKRDLGSLKSYRLALHRELFIRRWIENGGQGFSMSRQLMAKRLGVSPRTVQTYDKMLGFSNQPNFKEQPVTWENWRQLPRYRAYYGTDGRRLPSKQWLKIVNYATDSVSHVPLVRYLAFQGLKDNCEVRVVERLPNTYFPYQKADVSRFDSWDVASYYFADLAAKNEAGLFQKTDGSWYYLRE